MNRRATLPVLCALISLLGLSGCNLDQQQEKMRLNSDPGSYQKELTPATEQSERQQVRSHDKLASELRVQDGVIRTERLRVVVRDATESGRVAQLVTSLGGRVVRMGNQSTDLIIELASDQLPALTGSPSVVRVEPGPAPA